MMYCFSDKYKDKCEPLPCESTNKCPICVHYKELTVSPDGRYSIGGCSCEDGSGFKSVDGDEVIKRITAYIANADGPTRDEIIKILHKQGFLE